MKTIDTYKKELVRKYIDGSITSEEHHVLEKLALDDAMLFDMLEGLSYTETGSDSSLIKNINELAAKINGAEKKQSRKLYQWISVAASLIIILGFAIVIRNNISENDYASQETSTDETFANRIEEPEKKLASKKDQDKVREVFPEEESSVQLETKDDADADFVKIEKSSSATSPQEDKIEPLEPTYDRVEKDATSNEVEVKGSRSQATDYYVDGVRVSAGSPAKDLATEEEKISSTLPTKSISDLAKASSEIAEDQSQEKRKKSKGEEVTSSTVEKEELAASSKEADARSPIESIQEETAPLPLDLAENGITNEAITKQITGVISDVNGEPLIGANVILSGTENGTITDIDGVFNLTIGTDDELLVVSYTGFDTEEINLAGRTEIEVSLREGALLDEVVVVGAEPKVQTMPSMGFDSFREYIDENMVVPEGCETEGATVLDFQITVDGTIRDIVVQKSAGEICDAEAIRLLLNAGNWQTVPPRRAFRSQYSFNIR